jgi:hexosaminidase
MEHAKLFILTYALCMAMLVPRPSRAASVTLAWDYLTSPAPETFVVRRSLDGTSWADVGTLPGQIGTAIRFTDTTLPTPATPLVVQYQVLAQADTTRSAPSNTTSITLGGQPRLPTTALTVVAWDSQETVGESDPATNAVDGKPSTFWHTQWHGANPPPPHWVVLDLGQSMSIDGLAYLPRQDPIMNGTIAEYEVAVSPDGTIWGAPVAQGTWTGTGKAEQFVRFAATQGRFVKLTSRREVRGDPWTSAAEIGVYAAPLVGPPLVSCVTTQPAPKTLVITCTLP